MSHYSELDERIYREADIYVDHFESANRELAGLLDMGIKFSAEIGQLISKERCLKNSDNNKITIFQSLGEYWLILFTQKMVSSLEKKI